MKHIQTSIVIDNFPVKDLGDRYGISSRTAIYTRLKSLEIKPIRKGNSSYISAGELQLLDELDEFVKAGGKINDFMSSEKPNNSSEQSTSIASTEKGKDYSVQLSNYVESAIEAKLAEKFITIQQVDPLANFKALEDCAKNSWLLPTSKVARLVELSPNTVAKKQDFEMWGFKFSRAGKQSNEIVWSIDKVKN